MLKVIIGSDGKTIPTGAATNHVPRRGDLVRLHDRSEHVVARVVWCLASNTVEVHLVPAKHKKQIDTKTEYVTPTLAKIFLALDSGGFAYFTFKDVARVGLDTDVEFNAQAVRSNVQRYIRKKYVKRVGRGRFCVTEKGAEVFKNSAE